MIVREWPHSARFQTTNRHESFAEDITNSAQMSVSYSGISDRQSPPRFDNTGRSEVFQPGGSIFQRQESFDLDIKLSTEPVMEQSSPSYRSISEEADRLLKSMEERRNPKWFTSIKPIGYIPGSLYNPRKRSIVEEPPVRRNQPQVMPKPVLRVSQMESF